MKKMPAIISIDSAIVCARAVSVDIGGGRYVPARPEPFYGMFSRIKATWLVFTGRADALTWEGQ